MFTRSSSTVGEHRPPAGWSVVDFAVHPSGRVSVVSASDTSLELAQLDATGMLQRRPLVDRLARHDPRVDEGGVFDAEALVPMLGRDAVRIAPLGEDLALAARTGTNAVVAYRLRWTPAGLDQAWCTLVEPGMTLVGRFLRSGSFDVFDPLVAHLRVHLDTDDAGRIYVAVGGGTGSNLWSAHAEHFQESPITAAHGVLLTQLSPAGVRTATTVIDTVKVSELHGLRATPQGVASFGRVRTELRGDGTGWDAYAALVAPDGSLRHYGVIDVDAGDVLFDISATPDGRYLAAGATGYNQNPAGASISETASPLIVSLSASAVVQARHPLPAGPRQNQVRSVLRSASGWLTAGWANSPGTHSGDADPTRISAEGFLTTIPAP